MKHLRISSEADAPLNFLMSRREKALLLQTLRLYPVLDTSFHRLTRDPKASRPGEQRLLEDSMRQMRLASRSRLEEFLSHPHRYFGENGDSVRLKVSPEQAEWLMRILNDIRVGSWVQLGCPDPTAGDRIKPSVKNQHAVAAMELSGYFQACLLQGFD